MVQVAETCLYMHSSRCAKSVGSLISGSSLFIQWNEKVIILSEDTPTRKRFVKLIVNIIFEVNRRDGEINREANNIHQQEKQTIYNNVYF